MIMISCFVLLFPLMFFCFALIFHYSSSMYSCNLCPPLAPPGGLGLALPQARLSPVFCGIFYSVLTYLFAS